MQWMRSSVAGRYYVVLGGKSGATIDPYRDRRTSSGDRRGGLLLPVVSGDVPLFDILTEVFDLEDPEVKR